MKGAVDLAIATPDRIEVDRRGRAGARLEPGESYDTCLSYLIPKGGSIVGMKRIFLTRMHTTIATPIGRLTLVGEGGALVGVYYFPGHWTRPDPATFGERSEGWEFADIERQLAEYLAGERTKFALRTALTGDGFRWRAVPSVVVRRPCPQQLRMLGGAGADWLVA